MAQLDAKSLAQLKKFIEVVKTNTDIIHTPELKFFKDYLTSLHASIPPKKQDDPIEEVDDDEPVPVAEQPKKHAPHAHAAPHEHVHGEHCKHGHEHHAQEAKKEEPPPVEVVEEDNDPEVIKNPDQDFESIEMGDSNKEVSEDDDNDSLSLMGAGRKAAREQKHDVAIAKLTEAILLNPKGSSLFATRAESFLELKRPNAAIKDCNRALELNPDSAKALKARGKARRFLGKYAEAFYDLQQGNLLDWDENTEKIIKEIKERAEKGIQQKRKDDEKKRVEDLKREAAEKRRKQQDEADKRQREDEFDMGGMGGMGGMPGMGGMGGMPGGMGGMAAIYQQLLQDPEIGPLLKDPETQKKLMGFFMSGGKQYADDPIVQKVTEVLARKVPSGGPGPVPGAGAGVPKADDDLD